MLVVEQLVKDYKKHRAVDHLNFTVNPGEIVGLLGPNGAGKTSALRCVAGILRPTEGRVLINNYDVVLQHPQATKFLAFVPELPNLYELLTVDEHLKFVAMAFDTLDVYHAHSEALLSRYQLLEKRNELVATLSKGMRQKLAVACAMVHNANVLLMDEPVIGVDPQGVHEIKKDMAQAKEAGCSVLISTHVLDTAEKLCDRVVILNKGLKMFEGTLEELRVSQNRAGASLEDLFLELTGEQQIESAHLS
ncbi:MAG: ABC transporter ATP-binding protein [Armatimonadetes bacterium]|nr:ABC transporter ATP-binding protein [Armatimonadota bacterium]